MGCSSSTPAAAEKPVEKVPAETTEEEDADETPTQQADASAGKGKPELTTGFMTKQGKFHKSWKRRFFVIDKGLLTYYETETFKKSNVGKNELGKLNLRGYTVSNPSQSKEKILLSCPSDPKARELLLEVKNEDSRKAWIEAITRHIEFRDSLTEEEHNQA